MVRSQKSSFFSRKKGAKYALIIFGLWVVSPIVLAFIVYLINSSLLNPSFLSNLLIPAIILSIFSYAISKVKNPLISKGVFFALVGALIWASPAIYFLPASNLYQGLSQIGKLLVIILPAAVLSTLFFILAKAQMDKSENLSELYLKKALYSR